MTTTGSREEKLAKLKDGIVGWMRRSWLDGEELVDEEWEDGEELGGWGGWG